ncbi:MAG: hypothetical protein V5A51_07395, partial [Bacteroidales bacterium]
MNKLTADEIKALVKLLDDPNEEIYNQVSGRLLDQGYDVIPKLEAAWEQSFDEKIQSRLENLIQEIQFNSAKNNFREWAMTGGEDLFEGAFLLA